MRCKQDDCVRRARSRGWCTTHYRRWRAGQPMDAPVRDYARHEVGEDGECRPVTVKAEKPKRQKPFAAEYALLAELGLYDEHGHRIVSQN
jgi:hypothetical protein